MSTGTSNLSNPSEQEVQSNKAAKPVGGAGDMGSSRLPVVRSEPKTIAHNAKRAPGLPAPQPAPLPPIQTLERFLEQDIPIKEPLIDGLLYRRDVVALAGRRRNGKTTFIGNLALSLTLPRHDFLEYPLQTHARVLVFYLEDDAGELQIKLRRMSKEELPHERLALYTRDDFYREKIPIDVRQSQCTKFILARCKAHRPDIIVLDNLSHLIGANYNDPKLIHTLMQFVWQLTKDFNAAVIIAAHPRKRDNKTDSLGFKAGMSLRSDPEGFFEEVMGSSHFVNSCGSLWGIERDPKTDRTDFLGGAQRFTGQQSLMVLEKDEKDWLYRLDDLEVNLPLALNTPKRKAAWELLPSGGCSYLEAERAAKPVMKSASTFHAWFEFCKRLGVIVLDGDKYRKATPAQPVTSRGK
jgi:hypothetical protein